MLGTLAAAALMPDLQPASRWQKTAPFPGIAWTQIDVRLAGQGVANLVARRERRQARILWIDGSANIGATSTPEGVRQVVRNAAEAGFNTLVYDVKPIVGRTLYPSRLAPQLLKWKEGHEQTAGWDPFAAMVGEARSAGLMIFASINAFSEGHSYAWRDREKPDSVFGDPGRGYQRPDLQTVQYEADPEARWNGGSILLDAALNPAGDGAEAGLFSRVPSKDRAFPYVEVDEEGRVAAVHASAPSALPSGRRLIAASRPEEAAKLAQLRPGQLIELGSRARLVPIGEAHRQIPLMMNPHLEENQAWTESIAREIASGYDVDGLLFDDRLRFGGLESDFSPEARSQFEARLGRTVRWPEDVYEAVFDWSLGQGLRPGPFFDAWLAFRTGTMQAFIRRIRTAIREERPGMRFGIYAGSWYGDYVRYGSNYGSSELSAGFPFLSRSYRSTGFAADLDLLVTGCYYPVPTTYQAAERGAAPGRTVEAAGLISNAAAADQTWTVAGIMLADYWGRTKDLEHALQAAAATTQGVMVFDYSHRIEEVLPLLSRAFRQRAKAPYEAPSLIEEVRRERARREAAREPLPPFPVFEGAPGAGF
jgi:uncharacterized lipoprotein YddW (UPF0748 family)